MHIKNTSSYKLKTNISLPDILVEQFFEMPDLHITVFVKNFEVCSVRFN